MGNANSALTSYLELEGELGPASMAVRVARIGYMRMRVPQRLMSMSVPVGTGRHGVVHMTVVSVVAAMRPEANGGFLENCVARLAVCNWPRAEFPPCRR
jgi:hypothetical protein